MSHSRGPSSRRNGGGGRLLFLTLLFALVTYFDQVLSSPIYYEYDWPSNDAKSIESLTRNNFLMGYKRSIANLAKNGMLPTIIHEDENATEKRNIGSIAFLKSTNPAKKSLEALIRNGQLNRKISNPYDKRNIGALARDGLLKDSTKKYQKKESNEAENYAPFFQNPMPPLSEVPWDYNGMFDYMEAYNNGVNSASRFDKRHVAALLRQDSYLTNHNTPDPTPNAEDGDIDEAKRGPPIPKHGILFGKIGKPKRNPYAIPFPDDLENNSIIEITWPHYDFENEDKRSVESSSELQANFEKRHIGSLARLGWLPTFRFTGSRYSRSGRDPYQNWQYSDDKNFGIRGDIFSAEAESKTSSDDPFISASSVSSYKDQATSRGTSAVNQHISRNIAALMRKKINSIEQITPKVYHFRSVEMEKI